MLKQTTAQINGDTWTIRLMSDRTFRKTHGTGAEAMTVYLHRKGLRTIDFRKSKFCKSTVVHEVTHAYLSYYDFRTVPYGQIEEKFADLLGARGHLMRKVSDTIYRKFR